MVCIPYSSVDEEQDGDITNTGNVRLCWLYRNACAFGGVVTLDIMQSEIEGQYTDAVPVKDLLSFFINVENLLVSKWS